MAAAGGIIGAAAPATAGGAAGGADAEVREVLVKFVTSFAEARVPAAAISLPGNLNRAGLSQVINHLLGRGEGW